jgi:hypothetical protein
MPARSGSSGSTRRRLLGAAVSVLLFAGAVFVLRSELRQHSLSEILDELRGFSPLRLFLALAATLVSFGCSPEEKVYTYYGVDNMNMTMASVPKGTVQGDTWTYHDEGTMGGKKVKTRVTIKELSPTAYTFKMEMQGTDGKWTPMMESKNTKVQ